MVLLIKNTFASFEDFAHLSNLAGEAHGKLPAKLGGQDLRDAGVPKAKSMSHLNLPAKLGGENLRNAGVPKEKYIPHLNLPAKLSGQNLRNAGVPKAKSMPHLSLLTEGGTLRAHCSAVLNADFQGLKPGKLFARKVKSAKDDLKDLFDHASRHHRVEPGGPAGSVFVELGCSTAASDVTMTKSPDPSSSPPSSPTFAIPAPFDEEEDEAHLRSLTAAARGWLAFKRLFPMRRALSDPTVEEARRDFCQALIQSFPDHLSSAPSPHLSPSSKDSIDLTRLNPASSISPLASLGPAAGDESPEFSDEELQREFDSFSFHSSEEEDWTSEVESRKQNAFNRTLSEMKRELAIPIPRLSAYFSDDSLADSAAQSVPIKSRTPCSAASSETSDESSIYSADEEDELDEDEGSVAVSPPGSPARSDAVATFVPLTPEPLLFDAAEQDVTTPSIAHVEDGTDDVWKALALHVPRLLTSISEESLADEYEIEATGQAPPPLSFQRPLSEYRKRLHLRPRFTSLPDCMDSKPVVPGTEPSDAETSFATTETTDVSSESPEVSFQSNRTLRRVRKFADLKNLVILPTTQSTSSTETLCDTISLHEEPSFSESQPRRLRRAPRYLDLRKAFCGTNHRETPSSLHGRHSFENTHSFENAHSLKNAHSLQGKHSLQNLHSLPNLKRRRSFEEQYPPTETGENLPIPRCDVRPSKPVLPQKPPGLLLRWKRSQLSPVTTQEPPSMCLCCDLASSLPLYSCAKITRSKAKQGRAPNVSRKALKKRLDAIPIEPETVHGHSPIRSQNIPSIGEIRKGKMLAKLFKARRFK